MPSVFEDQNNPKAIMRVGLPAMLGQLTTLIYNLADTFFVSLTKEPAMIAAVTLCAPILLIIMSIACVFGMGGGSVIARLLGEEKKEESGTTMNFCVYAMAIAGIAVLALGLAFLQPLAKISGADADNIAYTCDYLKWIFLGAPFIMMANGFVHLFRSVGLIKEGTIGLVLGNAINMVLDYVFIAIFRWGTAGAAVATSLGFACAAAGAGIAYLMGGGYEEVVHTVVNALAIVSGMVCDGAKASCAAKIAASVDAGILGYNMFLRGQQFYAGDGIVTKGVEATISNIGRLGKDGMKETNEEIIKMMIND